jgi:hypothetical protein
MYVCGRIVLKEKLYLGGIFKCLKTQEFIYVVCTVLYGSSIGFAFNLYVVSRR